MSFFLLSPLLWGLVCAVVLAWRWRRAGRAARGFGLAACAACWLACSPIGANALVAIAEARLPESAQCDAGADAPVVVLAGGFVRRPRAVDDYAALNPESWRRLRGAVEFRGARTSPLWISGGGPYPVTEGRMLARLAQDWGVPATAIHFEDRSQTTRESARALRGRLPARLTLVSSALHLPRAVQAFDEAGFTPCAVASSSDYVSPFGWGAAVPQASAIAKAQAALHELAGAVVYRLRGA